jgi:hypothetical protein
LLEHNHPTATEARLFHDISIRYAVGAMTTLGVLITAAMMTILVAETLRNRTREFPAHGWLGIIALALFEWLMFRKFEPVATYFTPIAWTCYILIADAAIFSLNGRSRLEQAPKQLARIAALSLPLWLIFEAYNLRLQNWTYAGLPQNIFARYFGYGWSFATITPGIFVTADWIRALGWFVNAKPVQFTENTHRGMITAGALLLAIPLVLPREIAAYLFALVWLGFVFLLDPVNYHFRLPSLLGDLENGRRDRLYSLLISGLVCGFLWEFWNYWATAKWLYIFPMFQQWKIFEMPVPGFFGFPPFALECFTMYVSAAALLGWVKPR